MQPTNNQTWLVLKIKIRNRTSGIFNKLIFHQFTSLYKIGLPRPTSYNLMIYRASVNHNELQLGEKSFSEATKPSTWFSWQPLPPRYSAEPFNGLVWDETRDTRSRNGWDRLRLEILNQHLSCRYHGMFVRCSCKDLGKRGPSLPIHQGLSSEWHQVRLSSISLSVLKVVIAFIPFS